MMKKKIFLTFLILAFIAAGCGGTQSTGNFDQQAFEDAVDAAGGLRVILADRARCLCQHLPADLVRRFPAE